MKYYAIQVKTGGEEKFIERFRAARPALSFPLSFPKRILIEHRAGSDPVRRSAGVFPGYIFACISREFNFEECRDALRKTSDFYRLLPSTQAPQPLSGKDLEIILHFLHAPDAVAGLSKVYFNESDRIVVLEGPLSGLEGSIVKVDRRKGRAKVRLDLYGALFSVDLAFETIEGR